MEKLRLDATRVERLMPELRADLERLARIPSIAFPGYPQEPVREAHELIAELLRRRRPQDRQARAARHLACRDRRDPGAGRSSDGAPLCAPRRRAAGRRAAVEDAAVRADRADGAIYARGIADDKSNIIVRRGALRARGGAPPVGIKIVFEGQEEDGSPFDDYPPRNPELFPADAMVIADIGLLRPGVPTLTVARRGDSEVIVEGPEARGAQARRRVRRSGCGRADRAPARARDAARTTRRRRRAGPPGAMKEGRSAYITATAFTTGWSSSTVTSSILASSSAEVRS